MTNVIFQRSLRRPVGLAMALWGLFAPTQSAEAEEADAPVKVSSLSIEQAIHLALKRDARVGISQAAVEVAEENVLRARSFFFPDVTINGALIRRPVQVTRRLSDGGSVVIQKYYALTGQMMISQPLLDARLFPLYRQASLENEASKLSNAEQQRLIGFEAADAFLLVLRSEEVLRAAERRILFSRDRLRDAEARVEAGLVSSNDATRSALEMKNAERQLVVAQNAVALARTELGALLWAEIDGALVPPEGLLQAAASEDSPDSKAGVTVEARLDVRAARLRTQAAEAAAREPNYRAVPTLSLQAEGRYTNEAGLSGRNYNGSASLQANWSLWDGGDRSAESRARAATARAMDLQRTGLQRAARIALQRADINLRNARVTRGLSQGAAELAAHNADQSTELYRQGLSTALQVADANQQRFEAEVASSSDRYALALAYLDLMSAHGMLPPAGDPESTRPTATLAPKD
mgnify:CR=1 FL=1